MKIEAWPERGFPLQEKVPWGLWVQEELMLELNQILIKETNKQRNKQTNEPTIKQTEEPLGYQITLF